MTDETNLPPEVAEATRKMDADQGVGGILGRIYGGGYWSVIRDYLLHVTTERDALRAMIDGAPLVRVRGKVGEVCMLPVSHDFCGKRVRLVVEDGQ